MNRSRVTGNLSSHGILFSDITNDRVGIGSTIPTQKLDVTGIVKATSFVGSGANLTGIDATTIKHTDGNIKAQAIATGVNITGNLSINADSDQSSGNSATNYLSVGASQDLKLYHNGTQNYITAADGTLLIQADNIMLVSDDTAGRSLYQDNANSRLELGFDGTAAAYFSSSSIQFIKPVSSTGNLTITNTLPTLLLTDTDHDADWSVRNSNGNFTIYDETNSVGRFTINGAGTANVPMHLSVGNSISVTGNITGTGDLTLTDTTADSAAGPEFKLFRNSASPANADYLGQIKFAGESSTGVERNYAKITGKILDVTNGSEDGILEFAHIKAGSQTITGRWRSDSLQLLNSTNFSVAGTSEFTGDATFNGGAGAVTVAAASDIRIAGGTWTGEYTGGIKIQSDASNSYIQHKGTLFFRDEGSANNFQLTQSGNLTITGTVTSNGGFSGSGASLTSVNASTLANVSIGSLLRSDANDTASGQITLTSSSQYPLIIDSSDNGKIVLQGSDSPYIRFRNSADADKGYVQYNTTDGNVMYVWNSHHGQGIKIGTSLEFYHGSAFRTVWHANNDGSGSGLDADLWDGNQFASYLNQALLTSSTVSFDRIDVTGNHGIDNESWFRNDDSGDGLYNSATGQHFYSDDDDYWNIAGGTGANGLRFRDEHNGNIRGYVYANSSNQIGFLNQGGNWTIRTTTSGITKLGSRGYQIVDGNNDNNLYILSGASGATGISMFNNNSQWRFQIYGDGGAYGFLDSNWGGWDIKKTINGQFQVDEGSGLQRVWNAGIDGSGSGLDADTCDGVHGTSFLRSDTDDVLTKGSITTISASLADWMIRFVNNNGTNAYVYMSHGQYGMHIRNDSSTTNTYLLDVYPANAARFQIRGADGVVTSNADLNVNGGAGALTVSAHSDIRLVNGNWTGDYSCKIQHHSSYLYIQGGSNGHIFRRHQGSNAWHIGGDGHFHPGSNDSYDIGTSSLRVRNVYTTDLQLSNESKKDRGGNDVDGTWGDWTLQEGEDKIFMINNRTGKKYSLIMKEES